MRINEGFGVGDLELVLEPKLHIDEYDSKLGPNDKSIVLSFILNDKTAASDLVDFIEKGYDVTDADYAASEVSPGRYLVFVEMLRRRRAIPLVMKMLSDLTAASGIKLNEWIFRYMKQEGYLKLTPEALKEKVPLSPKAYRETYVIPLEKLKVDSGLPIEPTINDKSNEIRALKHSAGIS